MLRYDEPPLFGQPTEIRGGEEEEDGGVMWGPVTPSQDGNMYVPTPLRPG